MGSYEMAKDLGSEAKPSRPWIGSKSFRARAARAIMLPSALNDLQTTAMS